MHQLVSNTIPWALCLMSLVQLQMTFFSSTNCFGTFLDFRVERYSRIKTWQLVYLIETRKATGFKSLGVNYFEINIKKVTSRCRMHFSDKTCKKRSKTEKWPPLSIFTYSKWSTYQISTKIANFEILDKINPKRIFFWYKKENKQRITTEFHIFELVLELTFIFNKEFDFSHKTCPKKGCFRLKTDKMIITFESFIFESVLVPNFSLNWQFLIFGENLPKKGISCQKQKKWTSPLNSVYSNQCRNQISA